MVSKKPRIVIIGAGIAGLTAANKLYTSQNSNKFFELSVVEGSSRIGGRIHSSEFSGDRIELGATWIHGIENSPVYRIAQETGLLHSPHPWECMDGFPQDPVTVAEGGLLLLPSFVEPISNLYKNLMNFIQGKPVLEDGVVSQVLKHCDDAGGGSSVGEFLRRGLEAYSAVTKDDDDDGKLGFRNWDRKSLEEAVFGVYESIQRTYTSAGDLSTLDYKAEKEYIMFPGEEITIAKGYSSVIENLASVLPVGMIQLGKKVEKIEWRAQGNNCKTTRASPVKLHFGDGSTMSADHVIVTVSLGILKRGIRQDSTFFNPPLPISKTQAISKLGYGVVNKVFLELNKTMDFPFLQMVFHRRDSELRNPEIPHWIRRSSSLSPIYKNSRVVLSWFTGEEALEIESLSDEEIANGCYSTVSNLLSSNYNNVHCDKGLNLGEFQFSKVLRTQWGSDPLFLGSYSYVAVGSSGDDIDALAEPLPQENNLDSSPPLQILFAGEATHRTHYSTTHGAYYSGLREANRLLKHYSNMVGV